MEINISRCSECPFSVIDIDYDCVGNDTIIFCQLTRHLNKPDSIIDCYDSYKNESTYEECDYCKQWDLEMITSWNRDKTEVPFDSTKCKCHINQQKWFDEREKEQPQTVIPNWCPLKEVGELNIKLI